jgi:hypothetical protein
MRRFVLRGGHPAGIGGYLLRMVFVQQVARPVLRAARPARTGLRGAR